MTKTKEKKSSTGVVVEAYNHDKDHLIIVARAHNAKSHFFFYIKSTPAVETADILLLKYPEDKVFIIRRISTQPFKRFEINLLTWPGTLLAEVMSERINL